MAGGAMSDAGAGGQVVLPGGGTAAERTPRAAMCPRQGAGLGTGGTEWPPNQGPAATMTGLGLGPLHGLGTGPPPVPGADSLRADLALSASLGSLSSLPSAGDTALGISLGNAAALDNSCRLSTGSTGSSSVGSAALDALITMPSLGSGGPMDSLAAAAGAVLSARRIAASPIIEGVPSTSTSQRHDAAGPH